MILEKGGWFVVADGERYVIFENTGTPMRPELQVVDVKVLENPPAREQGADRPGRLFERGNGRSTVEQTDWHTFEKKRFGESLSKRLNALSEAGNFACIIIAADPRTLGIMRKSYSQKLEQQLAMEIPKDLTNTPVKKLIELVL